jgi:O-methyltransferase
MGHLLEWVMRTPRLNGVRGALGGRVVRKLLAAKRGTILYYNDPGRAERYDRVQKLKSDTHTLLQDAEAMFLYELVAALAKVPGDIAEVGTFRGGSTRLIAEASGGAKQIHAFDTFAGLPEPLDLDEECLASGLFASPLEATSAYLASYPFVHLYPGVFPETSKPVEDTRFSFVHLDVDLYRSTLDALDFFYPRLNRGAAIVSHDYTNARGVRRAFEEFFADKPECVLCLPGSQSLVIKR